MMKMCGIKAVVMGVSGLLSIFLLIINGSEARRPPLLDYGKALSKSLLFFEAQRSGKLPPNQRVLWRGDSALQDGIDSRVNLVGGYYDAGDNVKFGFPMAFTVTMLAWGALDFVSHLEAGGELQHSLDAVKRGADYFIKAHPLGSELLYGEVGDGGSNHACWQRQEDMTTPRTVFKIDAQQPGADLAAETSAALAGASILFSASEPDYATLLLQHSKQLFDFARNHPGLYQNSITPAAPFYSSSGFKDELLWAAAWLHRATNDIAYLDYLRGSGDTGGTRTTFSWDDKYLGVQVLVAKLVLEGKVEDSGTWKQYKSQAEQLLCSILHKGNANVQKTPGGLLWFQSWANLQYVTTVSFAATVYADYLSASSHSSVQCIVGVVNSDDLINLAKTRVDYILGSNPKGMSYMAGFGSNYPTQPHHRGASIVSIKKDPTPIPCQEGFNLWSNKNAPNPNVLDGALVGGPGQDDAYNDSRSNFQQAEPATATVAPIVGLLVRLA